MPNLCPSRYLRADGRIMQCIRSSDHKAYHYDNSERGELDWHENDPCAWELSDCPDCEGSGVITEFDDEAQVPDGVAFDCPTCNGSGTVGDMPTRLIGIGSKISLINQQRSDFIVIKRNDYHLWLVQSIDEDIQKHVPITIDSLKPPTRWVVTHAVPPTYEE